MISLHTASMEAAGLLGLRLLLSHLVLGEPKLLLPSQSWVLSAVVRLKNGLFALLVGVVLAHLVLLACRADAVHKGSQVEHDGDCQHHQLDSRAVMKKQLAAHKEGNRKLHSLHHVAVESRVHVIANSALSREVVFVDPVVEVEADYGVQHHLFDFESQEEGDQHCLQDIRSTSLDLEGRVLVELAEFSDRKMLRKHMAQLIALSMSHNQQLFPQVLGRQRELNNREEGVAEHDSIGVVEEGLGCAAEQLCNHKGDSQGVHDLQNEALADERHQLVGPGSVSLEAGEEAQNEGGDDQVDEVDHYRRGKAEYLGRGGVAAGQFQVVEQHLQKQAAQEYRRTADHAKGASHFVVRLVQVQIVPVYPLRVLRLLQLQLVAIEVGLLLGLLAQQVLRHVLALKAQHCLPDEEQLVIGVAFVDTASEHVDFFLAEVLRILGSELGLDTSLSVGDDSVILGHHFGCLLTREEKVDDGLVRDLADGGDGLEHVDGLGFVSFDAVQRHQVVIQATFLHLHMNLVALLEIRHQLILNVDWAL